MFDKTDRTVWITRAEIYFQVQNAFEKVKVGLACKCSKRNDINKQSRIGNLM